MSTSLSALETQHPDKSPAWIEGYLQAGTSCPVPEHAEEARQALEELHLRELL